MTLYNKDGTVYKLDGPNPVMKTQETWSEFIVHNMKWASEVHQSRGKAPVAPKKDLKTQSEIFIDELESSKQEQENAQELSSSLENKTEYKNNTEHVNENKTEIIRDESRDLSSDSVDIEKTFIYCLPAITREKKDPLYGDISKRIQYAKKTSFEAVIINQSDIFIEIWSEVVFQSGSILYPKNGDKRWWRVQDTYPKLGGHIMKCVPSQDQPYFD